MSLQRTKRKLLGYSFGDVYIDSLIRTHSKMGAREMYDPNIIVEAADTEMFVIAVPFFRETSGLIDPYLNPNPFDPSLFSDKTIYVES